MGKTDKDFLYRQLIRLGDMMGDGLHHEPDGRWIPREYKRALSALGINSPRKNNTTAINKAMSVALKTAQCSKCRGQLRQSRNGSCRAICLDCGAKFQFKKRKK